MQSIGALDLFEVTPNISLALIKNIYGEHFCLFILVHGKREHFIYQCYVFHHGSFWYIYHSLLPNTFFSFVCRSFFQILPHSLREFRLLRALNGSFHPSILCISVFTFMPKKFWVCLLISLPCFDAMNGI